MTEVAQGSKQWYIVHTYSGFEERVKENLHQRVEALGMAEKFGEIKIPTETQSGKVFRLRGKGIKGVRSQTHGDLLCHVVVETPVNLTARQKELLLELEAIDQQESGKHNPRAKSWMEKVKEFFQA